MARRKPKPRLHTVMLNCPHCDARYALVWVDDARPTETTCGRCGATTEVVFADAEKGGAD